MQLVVITRVTLLSSQARFIQLSRDVGEETDFSFVMLGLNPAAIADYKNTNSKFKDRGQVICPLLLLSKAILLNEGDPTQNTTIARATAHT